MNFTRHRRSLIRMACTLGCLVPVLAQDPVQPPPDRQDRPRDNGAPRGPGDPGPGVPGGPGMRGPGGPGGPGPMQAEMKVVKQFDKDGDKRLSSEERKPAREFVVKQRSERPGPRRGGFRGGNEEPPAPGPKLAPADVKSIPDAPLYDPAALRTLFLDFENADWEGELSDFYNTDVEIPARLTVDGKTYPDVGVHFRGASSFFTVGAGRKRSLNLSLDFAHEDQNLGGYRTLNLLNSHTDPTFLRTILYFEVARDYIPAPKANYVRVVINGESWGIYVNAQQFNKDFIRDFFGTTTGARWKVPGSPRGRGALQFLGEDPAPYKPIYDIRTKDDSKSWASLIRLCKVLNQTPPEELEQALAPILDIDATLKFLAIENALINSDGYWIRSSDYNLYLDTQGRFHLIPHDANETFRLPGGPGMARGTRVDGVKLDPLTGADDPDKPLLNKLLAVPALKARYLSHVRDIAEKWLDWERLGPLAAKYQSVISDDIRTDTRKLYPLDAFTRGLTEEVAEEGARGPRGGISLKSFVEQRREYLLGHPAMQQAAKPASRP